MRHYIRFLFISLFLFLSVPITVADGYITPPTPDKDIYGWVVPYPKSIEEPDYPPIGSRIPSSKLFMTISATGVEILGVDARDILLYEIFDLEDIPVGIFTDGASFVEALFSLSGEYRVRFMTDSYVYVGYVEL